MLSGGYIPPVTQIKNEPGNVIGNSQASSGKTSLDVQGASNCIPPTQQQWQMFQQQRLQQQPYQVQQLQQKQQPVQQLPQQFQTPVQQLLQQVPLPQQVPSPEPLAPPQQLPPQMPMRQAINRQDRIDTLPISLRYDGSDS